MITMIPGGRTNEYRGTSTDTKPVVHVPNGSLFYEMDTGDIYMFDADSNTWLEQ